MAWLAKEIPKSEHTMEKVQTAAHLVTRAAEHGGPMIFAQMGMIQAIHRHHKRVFNPDRKDPHWGRRKAKARYVMAVYLPFIHRHRCKASARTPCKASARPST